MAVDVSDALPEVSLQPKNTITVTFDDASTVITSMNVYALNLETGKIEEIPLLPPALVHEPQIHA